MVANIILHWCMESTHRDLERERERERERDRFFLSLFVFSELVLTTAGLERTLLASLILFMASSTSLFSSWGVTPCGFTMAFLLWFTLTGRSPNMAPLYCRAMGTESGQANSTNANLVGCVSSPAILTYLISPHGWKKVSTCSAVS
jgi:hypothetical protein